jgi:hypothetical protein
MMEQITCSLCPPLTTAAGSTPADPLPCRCHSPLGWMWPQESTQRARPGALPHDLPACKPRTVPGPQGCQPAGARPPPPHSQHFNRSAPVSLYTLRLLAVAPPCVMRPRFPPFMVRTWEHHRAATVKALVPPAPATPPALSGIRLLPTRRQDTAAFGSPITARPVRERLAVGACAHACPCLSSLIA